jgi:RNA polymerase sigma-70 factor (ECF subfamily)
MIDRKFCGCQSGFGPIDRLLLGDSPQLGAPMTNNRDPDRGEGQQSVAFVEVWSMHAPRLLEVVQRRVAPVLSAVLDAHDILQSAYLDADRRWDEFQARHAEQRRDRIFAWLYGIVMARLVDEYRRHTRERRDRRRDVPIPEHSSVMMGLSLVADGTTPSGEAVRREAEVWMKQALAQLGDTDREILVRHHIDALTFAELGESLGIAENTAAQRYVRALRKLRAIWKVLEPADGSGL